MKRTRVPGRPRAGAAWTRAALALALLAAVAAGTWWVVRRGPPAPPPARDPLATMAPESAYAEAVRLIGIRRSFASLPYLQHVLAARPEIGAGAHCVYATALYNSVFESDTVAGCAHPRWPSSLARLRIARESYVHMRLAIEFAHTPAERAFYCDRLGRQLEVMGFQWEALFWCERAAGDDPSRREYVLQHNALLARLGDPVRH